MANALFVRTDTHRVGACNGDEGFLASDRTLLAGRPAAVGAVGVERPALYVVSQRKGQDLIADAPGHVLVQDRERGLDPSEEVARHPVAARDPHLRRATVGEAEDA